MILLIVNNHMILLVVHNLLIVFMLAKLSTT